MNRQKCGQIGDAAEKALQQIAEEFGVQITRKGGNYSDGSATIKFEFAEIGEDGTAKTREAEDFAMYANRYGLEASDLGRDFTSRGDTFTISGCAPRARKMPILATRKADGKRYKFNHHDVKRALDSAA